MPVELRLSKRFHKSLEPLGNVDYARVGRALQNLQREWGAPHTHAVLLASRMSIRKLHGDYFECRAGLGLRIVFRATTDGLDLVLAGSHDDVRKLLRNE